jgi:hypothetical protein
MEKLTLLLKFNEGELFTAMRLEFPFKLNAWLTFPVGLKGGKAGTSGDALFPSTASPYELSAGHQLMIPAGGAVQLSGGDSLSAASELISEPTELLTRTV